MADAKQQVYEKAWHGEVGYDPKESIRLRKACELIAAYGPDGVAEVLDVGCGVGPLRQWLPADRFRITGVDISAEAIELARLQYDAGVVIDAENPWPFEPASFDAIHAGAVLEHVHDWHSPLNQANRVLKDRGVIVVAVPNLRYWKEVKRLFRGRQPHWIRDMLHVHGYTPNFLCDLLGAHGFEPVAIRADRVNLPLLPNNDWVTRVFAKWGSVLIVAAQKTRAVRVEDVSLAHHFPPEQLKPLKQIRAVEVLCEECEEREE